MNQKIKILPFLSLSLNFIAAFALVQIQGITNPQIWMILGLICLSALANIYFFLRRLGKTSSKSDALEKLLLTDLHILATASFDGKFLKVNKLFWDTLGYSETDIYAKKITDFVHPEDIEKTGNELLLLAEGNHTSQFKNRYLTKQGTYRTLLWSAVPDMQNKITYAIAQDITDDIEQKNNYKRAIEQLNAAQSTAKIGSWDLDINTLIPVWSDELFKIFEIEKTEGIEKDLSNLYRQKIYYADLPELEKKMQTAVDEGQGYDFQFRLSLKEGTVIKHVRAIANVRKNEQGQVYALYGTCQDITQQVLSEQESQFTLNALGLDVWKYNPNTQALYWDQSMYKLFEIDPKNFSGDYQAWESTLTPQAKEQAIHDLQAALRGEKEFNTTFDINTKSGKLKHIGGRGHVFRDESGHIQIMYGINWDRTKEYEMEQSLQTERAKSIQSAKLASLGEMSAGIAHEINNPLAVIAGNIAVLPKYKDDLEKFESKCQSIVKATDRISKIVRGLKKFSRTSSDQQHKYESLDSIIEEIHVLVEAKAKRANCTLQFPQKTNVQLLCDSVEIEQVLINLVNNAIDATAKIPSPWVKIEAEINNPYLQIRVTDAGNGIAPQIAAKLFQPFFTTKPVGEGTGLGLSIVKGIVEQHNGTIQIDNTHQHTCFDLKFRDWKTE